MPLGQRWPKIAVSLKSYDDAAGDDARNSSGYANSVGDTNESCAAIPLLSQRDLSCMFFVSSGEIHRYAGLTLRSAARFAVTGNIR